MSAASTPRILVVDDEAHLADGIRENLQAEGLPLVHRGYFAPRISAQIDKNNIIDINEIIEDKKYIET